MLGFCSSKNISNCPCIVCVCFVCTFSKKEMFYFSNVKYRIYKATINPPSKLKISKISQRFKLYPKFVQS